jgi:hypothetical protein
VRNLFFALLVVNLIFFGWSRWVDRPGDAALAAAPATSVPSLELSTLPPPAPTSSPAPGHCRSIGPFADAAATAATVDALHSQGLPSREREVASSVPDGYWVYVDDLKDAAARRKVITTLNAAGMRDAAAMPDESERVSVGVFSDQRHAVHRAEQVQELGFKPVLSVHQRPVSTLWLDVDLKPGAADPAFPPPPADASAKNAEVSAVRVIDCPLKGAAGG